MYLVLGGLPFPVTIMARLTIPWTGRRTRIAVDIFVFAAIEMAALGQSHRQNPHRLLLVQPAGALRKGFPRSRPAWIARFRFFPLHKTALPPMRRVSAITLPLPATRTTGSVPKPFIFSWPKYTESEIPSSSSLAKWTTPVSEAEEERLNRMGKLGGSSVNNFSLSLR